MVIITRDNKMERCIYCGREGRVENHLKFCKSRPEDLDKAKVNWLEHKFKVTKEQLKELYYVKTTGLRGIESQLKVNYETLKYLFQQYGFKLRSFKESVQLQNQKNKEYFKTKYGVENPFQIKEVKAKVLKSYRDNLTNIQSKVKKTNLKKYGVENQFQRKDITIQTKEGLVKAAKSRNDNWNNLSQEERDKAIEHKKMLMVERYGVENMVQLQEVKDKLKKVLNSKEHKDKVRSSFEQKGLWIPLDKVSEYEKYHRKVLYLTREHKVKLFEGWDGNCYYTKVKLVTNEEFKKQNPYLSINKNQLQPTIDHKVSIQYGFLNNIEPEEIAKIENLCICSRKANSIKNYRLEADYVTASNS